MWRVGRTVHTAVAQRRRRSPLLVGGLLATVGTAWWLRKWTMLDASEKEGFAAAGLPLDGLPLYTAAEIAEHKTRSDRIWVTYKEGVYDITWVQVLPLITLQRFYR